MKRFFFVTIFIALSFAVYACEATQTIDISGNNGFYKSIREHFDRIELVYIKGDINFERYKSQYFLIEKINYYGYKKDVKYFLGYIDPTGVYNKNNELIKKCIFKPTDTLVCVGLSSFTLKYPFEPNLILKDIMKQEYGDTEVFAYVKIDFANNTLAVYEPEY